MKCHWYIQSNLNAIESQKVQVACEGNERPVTLFKVIPFNNRLPRLNATWPFVLIGSTTLNRNALKSQKYKKGIFFNNNFTPENYSKGYGENYLNYDLAVYKLKDIPQNLYAEDDELFIRSNDDSKNISGGTVLFGELLEIQKNTNEHWISGDLFKPTSEICISSKKEIYSEYRLIVCENEVIASSEYRPTQHYFVPKDIIAFGAKMINIWQPHDIFVLDICETDDGPKVVECNSVNGAGWYNSNYGEIVYRLSKYQENL